jgi:hypothetical protein
LSEQEETAAIDDTEWLMRIRVSASETLREQSSIDYERVVPVLSGLLEDLQSAFDIAPDAYAMFALTYTLRRDAESQTDGEAGLIEAALDAIGGAIAKEQGVDSDEAKLYRMGFMNGLAAAVKNIHMNA